MRWIAQCHLCGKKQTVPAELRFKDEAIQWACAWEDEHIKEEHDEHRAEQNEAIADMVKNVERAQREGKR